jgi:adenosylhomocysteine nucleosidase
MRSVVVLAPMPLEMHAIVKAFGLAPFLYARLDRWFRCVVEAFASEMHIVLCTASTRGALTKLFESGTAVDHVMIAGICGGLDPDLEVGTLINPETVVDHTTGASFVHTPPGDAPTAGKLVTTEGVSLDQALSRRFFAEGFIGVDMETSAVAEVCEARGCPWSVYRCIGDRHFDGLLDERVVALSNPDGSGRMHEIAALLEREPEIAERLARLSRDASNAARLAAEAAVRGCLAL